MGQYSGAPAVSHAWDGAITQQQKQLNLIHVFVKILTVLFWKFTATISEPIEPKYAQAFPWFKGRFITILW